MVRYLTTKGCQLCIYSKKSLKNTQWLQWFILVDVLLVTLSTILSALIFKAIFRTFLIETINLNCRFFSFFSFLPFLNFRAITFLTYQVPKKTSEGVKFTIYLLFFFFQRNVFFVRRRFLCIKRALQINWLVATIVYHPVLPIQLQIQCQISKAMHLQEAFLNKLDFCP